MENHGRFMRTAESVSQDHPIGIGRFRAAIISAAFVESFRPLHLTRIQMDSLTAKRYLPWVVAAALFMEQLDSTIVNTAVPAMAASFHVAPLSLKVVVASYILSLAVCIPVSGWMADRFGTRRECIRPGSVCNWRQPLSGSAAPHESSPQWPAQPC